MNILETEPKPLELLIILLLTLALLGAGTYHLLSSYCKATTWEHADGRIISAVTTYNRHGSRNVITIAYRTPHSPALHTIRAYNTNWRGEHIDVLYHPQHPDQAIANTFSSLYDKGTKFCLFGGLLGAVLLVLLLGKRYQRRMKNRH